jgi:putative ABC transport system ATP-binding protein
MEEILKLENVYKSYLDGNRILTILEDVNLSIYKGQFIAIAAPSGSGKSTLLNIMAALDRPTKGNVYIEGQNIATLSDDQLSKIRNTKIGFVFQSFNLIQELTALENVALPLVIRGLSEQNANKKASEILKRLNLGDRLNFYPSQLSGGQKQRVAIARALVTEPKIIFMDEPTGNLDPDNAKEVLSIIRELHQLGNTIVLVTHDFSIAKMAEKIYTIKNKRIYEFDI